VVRLIRQLWLSSSPQRTSTSGRASGSELFFRNTELEHRGQLPLGDWSDGAANDRDGFGDLQLLRGLDQLRVRFGEGPIWIPFPGKVRDPFRRHARGTAI